MTNPTESPMSEDRSDAPFWSDDFDMDLPKVIPDAKALLGELADLKLVTTGHETYGRLNHPSVWNHDLGVVAFFGRPGRFQRHSSFVSGSPDVRCTLWEALRDAWSHDYAILLEGVQVWPYGTYEHFEPLMYALRGWRETSAATVEKHKAYIRGLIKQLAVNVRAVLARDSSGIRVRHD